ncbi:hypothetical protein HU200_060721 [Digitaria exilis]|uniref:Uncharacterized protein n=1 Tax=Digitaria exilis TaxID=1010633 RepID=A0A835DXA7_9POAL|nr:hypothetical protein HU200_060721 [Digitaria exilis]
MTKQHKDDEAMKTKKPKGDEATEMLLVDAGSSDEQCGKGRRKTKRVTWRSPLHAEETTTEEPNGVVEAMKPKDDEAEMLVVDAGSKETGGGKRRKKKLSQELVEYLRTKEVMGFIATETPRPFWPNITGELFDHELREEIAAQFAENREFDAQVLYQYRTKGYAEIQEEVEVDDEVTEVRGSTSEKYTTP